MSDEITPPKKMFFKMPENFAELSDQEIDAIAQDIFTEFTSRLSEKD